MGPLMEVGSPARVLVVEDEPANRNLLRVMIHSLGHQVEVAGDGAEALDKLHWRPDLVLLDVEMPGMDGYRVAEKMRESADQTELPIIMVTGRSGREDRLRAVEAGANDFISKPVDLTELRIRISSQLALKASRDALARYQEELESQVASRTRELRQALEEMTAARARAREAELETIYRLALAAEIRDAATALHIRRVSRLSRLIAGQLGLPVDEVDLVGYASALHDVGKIAIPSAILLKPGKLDQEEWEQMKAHTTIGAKLLADSPSELLRCGEVIARSHHERWDGSGYPEGLAGERIPLWGRICAVSDVFDALTSERPYKPAFSNEEAVRILRQDRGSHFDPMLVDVFLEGMDEVMSVQRESSAGPGSGWGWEGGAPRGTVSTAL
jgi:putative two-component system response regulator